MLPALGARVQEASVVQLARNRFVNGILPQSKYSLLESLAPAQRRTAPEKRVDVRRNVAGTPQTYASYPTRCNAASLNCMIDFRRFNFDIRPLECLLGRQRVACAVLLLPLYDPARGICKGKPGRLRLGLILY